MRGLGSGRQRQWRERGTPHVVASSQRRRGYTIEPKMGRGKGSHQIYVVLDGARTVLAQFTLTHHPRDLTIRVLRAVEKGLETLFGERWMEK